uniref:B30.2/SPRY domain-containing protein n=1 Tax=Dicentrarchus labrax TaxID=13489 RepID=A0A8P4GIQ9_DICLA
NKPPTSSKSYTHKIKYFFKEIEAQNSNNGTNSKQLLCKTDCVLCLVSDPKTLSFGAQKEEDDKKKTKLEQLASTANRVLNLNTHDSGDQKKYEKGKADLKSVQLFAVDVTLDPETAHPHLILSGDEKQVHHGDVRQRLPYNPKRFKSCVNILGKQSLSSGRFYFEVQVKGKTDWTVGVVTESIDRKEDITLSPEDGFWTVWLRDGNKYDANDENPVCLSLKSQLQKVGVFVDYEKGLVSFYDVDTADQLYSFTDCSFTEKLYPFFSPCTNDGGRNSAPLIICPVKPPLNIETLDFGGKKEYETKKAELKSVQQFAVDVTLDPDTAHPALFLSDDGKQVHDGDVWKKLQYNSKRFKKCVNVLGKQSFSSGRFYFEVQVKGKTAWTVGVATESIDRKEDITLSPEDGFWTVWLRDGNKYDANDENPVCLSLKSQLQRVGVFVDYEKGLVSFYDVDTADQLYSFTDCSFTEKLYPFFSPCTNDGGRNSAPLIICPINHNN